MEDSNRLAVAFQVLSAILELFGGRNHTLSGYRLVVVKAVKGLAAPVARKSFGPSHISCRSAGKNIAVAAG